MTTTRERRQAFRTIEGWAIGILLSAGATRECDEHGDMKERADHPTAPQSSPVVSGLAVAWVRSCDRK
jgi:hypothetical protein